MQSHRLSLSQSRSSPTSSPASHPQQHQQPFLGAPLPPLPPQSQPTLPHHQANLDPAIHDVGAVFEQERLRQMLAHLHAYNSYTRQQLNPIAPEPQHEPASTQTYTHPYYGNRQSAQSYGRTVPIAETGFSGPAQEDLTTDGGLADVPALSRASSQPGAADSPDEANYISNPPNLDTWRRKLFDLDEILVLSQDEYQTYFPHVDNVYSHRSTQRYKNRPFISHYWDCRLKGRPAGTPKSTDPSKKKRKRVARERDLCDVKIKITEYLPGASRDDILQHLSQQPQQEGLHRVSELLMTAQSARQWPRPVSTRERAPMQITADWTIGTAFYTVQRVSGGAGEDHEAGAHRHTLEESDRVKKNSVVRHFLKMEKEKKKSTGQVRLTLVLSLFPAAVLVVEKGP